MVCSRMLGRRGEHLQLNVLFRLITDTHMMPIDEAGAGQLWGGDPTEHSSSLGKMTLLHRLLKCAARSTTMVA